MNVRFGIEFGSYPSDLDPLEVCRQVSERAEIAYNNNFEALFVAQHYLTGPDAAILQRSNERRRSALCRDQTTGLKR
jgi:hypothetical protein